MSAQVATSVGLETSTEDLFALMNSSYEVHLKLLSVYFSQRRRIYRLGLVGDTPLRSDSPLRATAFEFGRKLADLGIDLVVTCGAENTFPGQAALGYIECGRTSGTKGRLTAVIPPSLLGSPNWGRHDFVRVFEEQGFSSVFEFMSGFVTDIVAFVPGLDSNATIAEVWQRGQLALKISQRMQGIEHVPLGLRLRNTSVDLNWQPRCICVGPNWGFLQKEQQTYVDLRTLNPDNGEHLFVEFSPHADDAMDRIFYRSFEWETQVGDKLVPLKPQSTAKVKSSLLIRKARQAYSDYLRYGALMGPKEHGYFRTAVFGSHHLPVGHPMLDEAERLGDFLGEQGWEILEGSGPDDSIMGRAALGHFAGRRRSNSDAGSYGISLSLPWENGESVQLGARTKIFKHAALPPRLDTFFLYATYFALLLGGVGTGLEDRAQRYRAVESLRRRGQKNDLIGMRLFSQSSKLGYPIKALAIGPCWDWRKAERETLLSVGALIAEDGEGDLMQFADDVEEATWMIREEVKSWRGFVASRGYPAKN